MQLALTRHNVEDLLPILVIPLLTLPSMAILIHSGRTDLAPFALSASLLMTVGQMGFFVAGEVVSMDRRQQLLDVIVASPVSYAVILLGRVGVLTALGILGFVEGWLIAWGIFGVHVPIIHGGLLAATLVATVIASTGTALLFTALLGLAGTTRTFQHAVNGPFYLLGGVLVPVHFLPMWLQPFAPLTFFYWAAGLVRDTLRPGPVEDAVQRLGATVGLGVMTGLIGILVIGRMLNRLRRDGTLSLT
ncbi:MULTISPECIES: ABC transporter permease [unclassified Sphingobium]|uniref:ABC transporter permease n=1 Tax=unclassified Sphingobium TaxID=2611147 RepID=UPI0009E9C3E7|nr:MULTISPECIES: ABC transporter permease [unclassified Sphingobium]